MQWLRLHWKASRQACALPKKSKRRRVAWLQIRPILTGETDCLHDRRAFRGNRCWWSSAGTVRSVQYLRLQNDNVQDFDGPSTTISKRNSNGNGLGRIVQVKIEGFCSASDCISLYDQETFRNIGQPSFQRLNAFVRLRIDQKTSTRNFRVRSGKRSNYQESKRKNLRGEECGRMFSVETKWTMFERRLLKFHPWFCKGCEDPSCN